MTALDFAVAIFFTMFIAASALWYLEGPASKSSKTLGLAAVNFAIFFIGLAILDTMIGGK